MSATKTLNIFYDLKFTKKSKTTESQEANKSKLKPCTETNGIRSLHGNEHLMTYYVHFMEQGIETKKKCIT